MKTKLLWLVLFLTIGVQTGLQAAVVSSDTALRLELKPLPQQAQAARLATELLTRYHYKAIPLDDAMSAKILDQYLKALDPEKLFFVKEDIDHLSAFRTTLDDAIFNEDLSAPFAIFNLYTLRVAERFAFARTLLKQEFDFRQSESYQFEREKEPWPQTATEMNEIWRKRVKNDWLRLKLAGKDDKSIAKTLDKRYENSQKRVSQFKSDDAFQAFMNAYTMAIEPHTNYMGPRAAEEFDIQMKLSLVGIGAVLAEKDDYTTIRELVPGGPAALSGQLKIGDRILGVAQGKGGAMVDVQGWRLDETVALIRGSPDSTVVLDVLPADTGPDGKHQTVSLARKKISLEEQSAKKSIVSAKDGTTTRRIGVITLPGFYEDTEARQRGDANFKSATRDVAKLLAELKQEKVDGVLVDLRNNGGGSLSEAIDLTGLFIGKGPVVQTRNAQGKIEVASDTDADVAWEGPLGVLINRGSASASEIFAAAIQDYGRGLIIGEPSFGKGTVQTMIDLDQIAKNSTPKFGALKLTIAQFFRVNGGTTQLRGVTPDIGFPKSAKADDFGESSFDNALPWMQVQPAEYAPAGNLKPLQPMLLTRLEAREKSDKDFLCLQESITRFDSQSKKNLVSLNEAERRKDRDLQETQQAACESGAGIVRIGPKDAAARKSAPGSNAALRDDGLQPDERNLATDLADETARKNSKDVLLNEAVHILGEEVGLLDSKINVTASVTHGTTETPN